MTKKKKTKIVPKQTLATPITPSLIEKTSTLILFPLVSSVVAGGLSYIRGQSPWNAAILTSLGTLSGIQSYGFFNRDRSPPVRSLHEWSKEIASSIFSTQTIFNLSHLSMYLNKVAESYELEQLAIDKETIKDASLGMILTILIFKQISQYIDHLNHEPNQSHAGLRY